MKLTQIPYNGEHKLYFRGDVVLFTLELNEEIKGKAFFRTNIGRGKVKRKEIIEKVEDNKPYKVQDWHDIRMSKVGPKTYQVNLALCEVGHFEGKSYFLRENEIEPVWPDGDNISINIEPAEYCCANSIYCAFTRQFGSNKENDFSKPFSSISQENIDTLDDAGYAVIPPSGTFRDLIKNLDFVTESLNCRIIHLLPINPTPTVYGRMGRFGSPYAALDFTAIDPSLVEFDRYATPLDQFMELSDAIHNKNAKLILDIAINHTGWAAKIHETNPEWLVKREDGKIHSPGAWGTEWGDLTELNHECKDLWVYFSEIFITWCERGVDGFRCDAGYMIPTDAWEYIIARVRESYPDTIFLLEGLGGDPKITLKLLNESNMNWAYSELFQNYSRQAIEGYINYSHSISMKDGLMVHYAETHDNNRLADTSDQYSKMRTALCALTSANGAFGFTNGVEWFAKEKIDVHEARALNWNAEKNQVEFIGRINNILLSHPAFFNHAKLQFVDSGCANAVVFSRADNENNNQVLIAINLNADASENVVWSSDHIEIDFTKAIDLIAGKEIKITQIPSKISHKCSLDLDPGEVVCITSDKSAQLAIEELDESDQLRPDRIDIQKAQAMALDVLTWKNSTSVINDINHTKLASDMLVNPFDFSKSLFNEVDMPYTHWEFPSDAHREVMLPPKNLLIVTAPNRFRVALKDNDKIIVQRDSLFSKEGYFFAIITGIKAPKTHQKLDIVMTPFEANENKTTSKILLLSNKPEKNQIVYKNCDLCNSKKIFFSGNGRGGTLRTPLIFGDIYSRYDALLAANLNPNFPEDRHIMWRRCRAWVIFNGRTQELNLDTIEEVFVNTDENNGGTWNFNIPVGNGLCVNISLSLTMVENKNAVEMNVYRHPCISRKRFLSDDIPIQIIIRPDIEDRNFHMETKASCGPENHWREAIHTKDNAFTFTPHNTRNLLIKSSKGSFIREEEWVYNIFQEKEATRGLESHSDLFSPGYFNIKMFGNDHSEIIGQVLTPSENEEISFKKKLNIENFMTTSADSYQDAMLKAMKEYVVKRDDLKTVIAGFPWFLDWGRDTLICVRGLIAAEMYDEVKKILLQFAQFAENGTLPNIIHGDNVGNRDTTDAPLWFFTACEDFSKAQGKKFLNTIVKDDKSLLTILEEIADGYINGTPNGIYVDKETCLVFSPSHFTWMDTNYPAGTPREGYPIEIQALWYAAQHFLAKVTNKDKWFKNAASVRESIHHYFVLADKGYLSDCLHCSSGTEPKDAIQDDHIRPNQLFAVTLGAVCDLEITEKVIETSAKLLIPGGIRSLADKPVDYKLPVHSAEGNLLNNPENPYWGIYDGDEDTRRKAAYHNGTAWSWPFPSYCEAYFMVYGTLGKKTAKAILSSSELLMNSGCINHIPEIMDGNAPHLDRGCDAQAWGVTELYRVWRILHEKD